MPIANWTTESYGILQSLLFNNPHRVIEYSVRGEDGTWQNRADQPAPTLRLYERETTPERTCLQTIQFVHHMLIPPGGRHVKELHIHPDAEEIVVVQRGSGVVVLNGERQSVQCGDVIYIPPGMEHELYNDSQDVLGVLFINVPTGTGLNKLQAAQQVAQQ